jgi:hypothetical protein
MSIEVFFTAPSPIGASVEHRIIEEDGRLYWYLKTPVATPLGPVVVSTARLFTFLGEPDEWETMIFPGDGEGYIREYNELACSRYASEEEAREGHRLYCETAAAAGFPAPAGWWDD